MEATRLNALGIEWLSAPSNMQIPPESGDKNSDAQHGHNLEENIMGQQIQSNEKMTGTIEAPASIESEVFSAVHNVRGIGTAVIATAAGAATGLMVGGVLVKTVGACAANPGLTLGMGAGIGATVGALGAGVYIKVTDPA